MTLDELKRETRTVVPLDEALPALGIGRTAGQAMAREGRLPVQPLRVGRKWVVPTAALRRVLAIEPAPAETAESRG